MLGVVLLFVLLIVNGIFSMSEMAVISARRSRLQQQADEGSGRAAAALALADKPTRFLSTVQIGITLVGILAGAFGQATLSHGLTDRLRSIPAIAPYASTISGVVVVLLITYLSLVVGELVPKRIAQHHPERIAGLVARPMQIISRLTAPVVHLLALSTDLLVRLLGSKPAEGPPVSDEEINALMQQGAAAGVFEESEPEIVRSIFRLSEREARAIMTPRPEIVWLDIKDEEMENFRKLGEGLHSRFPVAREHLDNILGVVQTKDLLRFCRAGEPLNLEQYLSPPLFVSETMPAFDLLERLRESRVQMALLVDEYGTVQGLVTLSDIFESIVGEMPSEGELEDPEAVQREDGSWLLSGLLPVDEFKDIFRVSELPGEDRGDYQTVGGFVMMQLGRIPATGDRFRWENLEIEVIDMDGMRVDKLLVAPGPAAESDSEGTGI